MKIKTHFIIATLIASTLCISCEKEVSSEQSDSNTFFKQYGTELAEFNSSVALSDDGFIMAGRNSTGNTLCLSYASDKGQIQWEKQFVFDGRFSEYSYIYPISNDEFLINDAFNAIITRVDKYGNIKYQAPFNNGHNGYIYSPLIKSNDNQYYIGSTDGSSKGAASSNLVSRIDPNTGERNGIWGWTDANLRGKTLRFEVIKAEGNTVWICGLMFEYNPWWSWSDKTKMFVMKTTLDVSIDNLKIYGSKDDNIEEQFHCHTTTLDGNMVIASGSKSWLFSIRDDDMDDNFTVRKIDNNLNLIWQNKIEIAARHLSPLKAKTTSDGNIQISGLCQPINKRSNAGFIVILNSSGKMIQNKIFDLGEVHDIHDFAITPENDWIFTGGIRNFGKNKDQDNFFYLKTDSDFNY